MDKLIHFEFPCRKIPQLDGTMVDLSIKIAAIVADTSEMAIVQAVKEVATASGVTDLYLLDKKFILDAIREKREREKPPFSLTRTFAFLEAMAMEAASEASRYEREGHGPAATLYRERIEALHIAADAIREKLDRENPKPLTIEELRQMHGEPVWVQDLNTWGIVEVCNSLELYQVPHINAMHDLTGQKLWGIDVHNLRCYRHKPKEGE